MFELQELHSLGWPASSWPRHGPCCAQVLAPVGRAEPGPGGGEARGAAPSLGSTPAATPQERP